MSAKFIYLVGQVGSFGPCFLVQPELVISCDVTFNLTFIDQYHQHALDPGGDGHGSEDHLLLRLHAGQRPTIY